MLDYTERTNKVDSRSLSLPFSLQNKSLVPIKSNLKSKTPALLQSVQLEKMSPLAREM